jgi:hypothetical protein
VWRAGLGQKAVLLAVAREWNVAHIVLAVVVGLLVLGGAGFAIVTLRRRLSARRGRVAVADHP